MDRREAVRRVAILMGGALSASTVAGVLGGCRAGEGTFRARTLTKRRDELVATIAELIIPETDTPGARAARVHEFIDSMLTDWYSADERNEFMAGLADVDALARKSAGSDFVNLTEEQQTSILTAMEEEALATEATHFFSTMKTLTIFGYYTSEIGATQELHLNPMGTYDADVPYAEIGRSWA